MNSFKAEIIKLLNKVYRLDEFVDMLLTPVGNRLYLFLNRVNELYCTFYFDSLTEEGCEYYEELLKITPEESDTLENRRSKIQAKWLSNNHNSINLIRSICSSWNDGEAEADFIDGKIVLQFVKTIGTPANLDSLLQAINEIKPAHIPILTLYRYLIIEEIHEVKTIEEMETLDIDMFEF